MAETLDKNLDNMEEVTEGSNPVTKNAKPGESIDTSKSGGKKVIAVTTDSFEGAAGTKNAGASAAGDVSVEKDKSLKTKPSDASSKQEEVEANGETIQEETPKTDYDFSEDVDALVAGEELTEEFRAKAVTIFEAAVTSRVNTEVKIVQEALEESLTEEVEKIKTELAEKVDDYLSYAAKTWMEENQLQVEHGIKTEMAESFFNGLKELFVEHNFSVPEEKFNLLDGMAEELNDMETKLNEQIEKNVSLNQRLAGATANSIFDSVSEGLADTQKEKLASLSESVEFESETEYREKLVTLKESYFPTAKAPTTAKTETLSEGMEAAPESHSASMAAYLKSMSMVSK